MHSVEDATGNTGPSIILCWYNYSMHVGWSKMSIGHMVLCIKSNGLATNNTIDIYGEQAFI